MKAVKVDKLVPGMILAQDVLIPRTAVTLLPSNAVLTVEMIRRIASFNINEVFIAELQKSEEEKAEERLAPVMAQAHENAVNAVREIVTNPEDRLLEEPIIAGLVGELLEHVKMDASLFLNLTHLKTYDNYLFSHSVNVSILALLIGEQLNYSSEELNQIGVAALLHDIGMLKIPMEITHKAGTLTPEEYDEIRKHPIFGEEFLAANNMSKDIRAVAAQHHERFDGSGYPNKLKGSDINYKARIVALADVYDACISERPYRERITPQEALRIIVADQKLYDPQLLKVFISTMAVYPIGSLVKLNTGEIGKVIKVRNKQPFRPVVQIHFDREEKLLEEPVRLDLSDEANHLLFIKGTLSTSEHKRAMDEIEKRPKK